MTKQTTRRRFLRVAGVIGLVGSTGCSAFTEQSQQSAAENNTRTTVGRSTMANASMTGGETATNETTTASRDGSGPADHSYSSFRRNLQRNGFASTATVPESIGIDWGISGINLGEHTASKGSVVPAPDGNLIVPGDTGEITSLTPKGTINWVAATHPSAYGIHGTPVVANRTVYIGAYDGALYAFDLDTGARHWRTQLGGSIGGSPTYHDGTIYIAVEFSDPDGSLFVVDAASGTINHVDNRPTDHPHSTPGIDLDGGTLSIGSNDGFLYTWEYPSLEFAHTFDAGDAVKAPIAIHDGAAFFGSWDEKVFRVDLTSGTADWTFSTGDLVMSGAAIDTDTGTVYIGSHDQNCYALDTATGKEIWRFETGGRITGCPTITSEHVLIGSYDGNLYAVEKESGTKVWHAENEGWITCEPLVHDGAVYYTERATDGVTGSIYRLVPA